MNLGIYDLNECSSLNYKKRLDIYKEVGFTHVGLYLDKDYMSNGEEYSSIIKYAKKIGLKINQVHLDYHISNLIVEDSDGYFKYVESKIKEAIKYQISYLVLHASKGNNPPLIDDSSILKLKYLMDKYKEYKVFLCFENVRVNDNLEKILNENINNVKMCFDVGHAYCYSNLNELLNNFEDKIICSHLHNNYKSDSHNRLIDGEVNIKPVIDKFNQLGVDNCLEVFPSRGVVLNEEEFRSFVFSCFKDYESIMNDK